MLPLIILFLNFADAQQPIAEQISLQDCGQTCVQDFKSATAINEAGTAGLAGYMIIAPILQLPQGTDHHVFCRAVNASNGCLKSSNCDNSPEYNQEICKFSNENLIPCINGVLQNATEGCRRQCGTGMLSGSVQSIAEQQKEMDCNAIYLQPLVLQGCNAESAEFLTTVILQTFISNTEFKMRTAPSSHNHKGPSTSSTTTRSIRLRPTIPVPTPYPVICPEVGTGGPAKPPVGTLCHLHHPMKEGIHSQRIYCDSQIYHYNGIRNEIEANQEYGVPVGTTCTFECYGTTNQEKVVCGPSGEWNLEESAIANHLITCFNGLIRIPALKQFEATDLEKSLQGILPEIKSILGEMRSLASETRSLLGEARGLTEEARSILGEVRSFANEKHSIIEEVRKLYSEKRTILSEVQEIRNDIREIQVNISALRTGRKPDEYRDCADIKEAEPEAVSGVFEINTDYGSVHVFCDMESDGGGWTVFQKRYDGSLDFDRNWNDYENGFGSPDAEYWLGLKYLYAITTTRRYELLLEVIDKGRYCNLYSLFDSFSLIHNGRTDFYRLRLGEFVSGTAGSKLNYQNGMNFAAKDKDNDNWKGTNCALSRHSGWWHKDCFLTNLNGPYNIGDISYTSGLGIINDGRWNFGYTGSEMKIRPWKPKRRPITHC